VPYIFIKSTYPSHKIDELLKKNLEVVPKYPPNPSLGETVVSATKADGQGIVSLSIYEVKKGKFEEAMDLWVKGQMEFRNIEGYEFSIETWVTAAEAFAAIGMTPP